MGSIDTNALLRLVLRDIPEQSDAMLALLEGGDSIQVADIALLETLFVLNRYYKMPRSEVGIIWQELLDHPQLIINRPIFTKTLTYYLKHPAWSPEDSFLLAHAQESDSLPLWTFDRPLASQSRGSAHLIPIANQSKKG